jgi:DNA ligase-1
MTFSDFSIVLQKIEKTTLRNEMMEILAELFRDASDAEIAQLVYLTLGCLRPKFDRLEFNLAEKMVMRSIARAGNTQLATVLAMYKEKGDLGIVAEELRDKSLEFSDKQKLSIIKVYDTLEGIAKEEGQGSQERKVEALADLLKELDSLSVRYVTRMVVGKLRLGFSDKTILDALSYMEKGSKEARAELDLAYQVSPDIGSIARLVKLHGYTKVSQMVRVTYGVPVVPALAQRLKTAKEMIEKMGEVAMEPKYDGTRVQIHWTRHQKPKTKNQNEGSLFDLSNKTKQAGFEVRTFTRNLDENSHMFPELQRIADQIQASEVILDSEAVGFDPITKKMLPFQMTITRKRKHGIDELATSVPLKFFVFDILYKDGESLIGKPFFERREILSQTITKGEILEVDAYVRAQAPQAVRDYHLTQLNAGLEGAMIKQLDGVYSPGRTGFNWVKFKEVEDAEGKLSDTIDGVVMGYYRGRGKRSQFGMGAFLIGVLDTNQRLVTLAKIGTGLSDEQWHEMKRRCEECEVSEKPKEYGEIDTTLLPDVWLDPHIVVEVAADEITRSPAHSAGLALRFPRLVRFRDDKSPSQATTVEELSNIC